MRRYSTGVVLACVLYSFFLNIVFKVTLESRLYSVLYGNLVTTLVSTLYPQSHLEPNTHKRREYRALRPMLSRQRRPTLCGRATEFRCAVHPRTGRGCGAGVVHAWVGQIVTFFA